MASSSFELSWRKFPRDSITKPEIKFISSRLPPHLKHAVFTFWTALYCNADDKGEVDLTDKDVICYQCMFDNETDLQLLISEFSKRTLIYKSNPEFEIYKIAEWEEPIRTGSYATGNYETISQRRERIARESAKFTPDPHREERAASYAEQAAPEVPEPEANTQESIPEQVKSESKPEESPAAENSRNKAPKKINDKKRKNVTEKVFCDKNQKNVTVTEREKEREVDRQERGEQRREGEEKETHTDARSAPCATGLGDKSPAAGFAHSAGTEQRGDGTPEAGQERGGSEKSGTQQEGNARPNGTGGKSTGEDAKIKENATGYGMENEKRGRELAYNYREIATQFEILQSHFMKEYGDKFPDPSGEVRALTEISLRLKNLVDEKNKADILANLFFSRFKHVLTTVEYYKTMPCLPSNMLKKGIWQIIFTSAQKILNPKGKSVSAWAVEYKKALEKVEEDQEVHNPEDVIALSYAKYGINPNDPNRGVLLAAAKARELHGK